MWGKVRAVQARRRTFAQASPSAFRFYTVTSRSSMDAAMDVRYGRKPRAAEPEGGCAPEPCPIRAGRRDELLAIPAHAVEQRSGTNSPPLLLQLQMQRQDRLP